MYPAFHSEWRYCFSTENHFIQVQYIYRNLLFLSGVPVQWFFSVCVLGRVSRNMQKNMERTNTLAAYSFPVIAKKHRGSFSTWYVIERRHESSQSTNKFWNTLPHTKESYVHLTARYSNVHHICLGIFSSYTTE